MPTERTQQTASLHGGFQTSPGHFSFHPTRDATSIFEHFHRSATTWHEFAALISSSTSRNKVLYFLRHAEGEHNAAKVRLGADVWFRDVASTDEYLDALLTEKGEAAATTAAVRLQAEIENGMPLQKVILSPLRRTLQTGTTVFGHQIGRVPFVAMELCRETMGIHTCDKRSAVSTMSPLFPMVDFSQIQDDQDVLWRADVRETPDDIQRRAVNFLRQVFELPETFIAVISHVGFISACLRVLEQPEYRVNNCEVVPIVLQLSTE